MFRPARLLRPLLPLLVLLAGCRLDESVGPDYEEFGAGQGDFGFRAVLGAREIVDQQRTQSLRTGFVYDRQNRRNPEGTDILVNGYSIRDVGIPAHQFEAGRSYHLRVTTPEGSVEGALEAPAVSRIELAPVPAVHGVDRPLPLQWGYPAGEDNDGALFVTTNTGYSSGPLAPGTRTHTIPATAFPTSQVVTVRVSSVRYLLFRQLLNPQDPDVVVLGGLDQRGSYFGLLVGVSKNVEVG